MSSNVPPAFKPIAHYIKIANENASRDPVIYYWWLPLMVFGTFTPTSSTSSSSEFNESSWRRLQSTHNQEQALTAQREALLEESEDVVPLHETAQDLAAKIEEKRVSIEKIRKQIALVNQKILVGRRKTAEVDEKISRRNDKEQRIRDIVKATDETIQKNQEKKMENRKITHVLVRLLTYRKLWMLKEVMDVFKVRIDGGPATRGHLGPPPCGCPLYDTIRGLHLPQSPAPFEHPEVPTIAAIHMFMHMFNVFSRILEYSPRFPIDTNLSNVGNPMAGKEIFMGLGWRRKADRDKFEEGVRLLGLNVSQLRMDSGIPTMVRDRTLVALEDWMKMVGRKEWKFPRPIESVLSPASLLVALEGQ